MAMIHSQQRGQVSFLRTLRRGRTLVAGLVVVVALLTATVAIAQSSQNYDLACRSLMTAGGGVSTGTNFALIGALGVPIVPPGDASTAPNYGVRAGFLPAYPNSASAAVAEASQQAPPAHVEQNNVQRLPFIFGIQRIILGC
jgi:hypothetical protein